MCGGDYQLKGLETWRRADWAAYVSDKAASVAAEGWPPVGGRILGTILRGFSKEGM